MTDAEFEALPASVRAAITVLMDLGSTDGDHHKQYAMDQTIRILTGCPAVQKTATDYRGRQYIYTGLGESELYKRVVAAFENGEDGPQTYSWDEGIAP